MQVRLEVKVVFPGDNQYISHQSDIRTIPPFKIIAGGVAAFMTIQSSQQFRQPKLHHMGYYGTGYASWREQNVR